MTVDVEILDRLQRIYPVSRETIVKFARYEELLVQWQKKTNLVAPSTLSQFWSRHVADSLQLLKIADDADVWTDIGSGGGFPGLILALAMDEISARAGKKKTVNLVESIQKKCAFLRRVGSETNCSVNVHPIRIESAAEQLEQADIITARALASLHQLLELSGDHISGNKRALFHKGRDYQRELEECRGKYEFDLVIHDSVIDAESVILEISNVKRVGR